MDCSESYKSDRVYSHNKVKNHFIFQAHSGLTASLKKYKLTWRYKNNLISIKKKFQFFQHFQILIPTTYAK